MKWELNRRRKHYKSIAKEAVELLWDKKLPSTIDTSDMRRPGNDRKKVIIKVAREFLDSSYKRCCGKKMRVMEVKFVYPDEQICEAHYNNIHSYEVCICKCPACPHITII